MEEIRPNPDRTAAPPEAGDIRFSPLDPFAAAAETLTPERIRRILWAFLLLGIAVRAIRFLLCFPLWPDEAYLAHNYLDRSYLDLLKPLDFIQIAPILYLWVQKAFVSLLGFSEYSLRLYSLLCGIASLFVFRCLAGRLLRGTALVLALAVFAVAYPLVRYSGEAKPYGGDMLVSLILVTLAILWQEQPDKSRWWWALTLAMPLAVLLSYPVAFMGGGICLAMAIELLLRSRSALAIVAAMGRRLCGPGRRRGRPLRALRGDRCRRRALPNRRRSLGSSPAAQFAGRVGPVPAGQPHGRCGRLSDRRQVGGQRADRRLLPGRLDPASAIAAILSPRVVRLALGLEFCRRREACLSLWQSCAVLSLHGFAAVRADRFGRGGNPRLDWRPPPPGFHARGRDALAPGGDCRGHFRPRFYQALQGSVFSAGPRFRPLVLDGEIPRRRVGLSEARLWRAVFLQAGARRRPGVDLLLQSAHLLAAAGQRREAAMGKASRRVGRCGGCVSGRASPRNRTRRIFKPG